MGSDLMRVDRLFQQALYFDGFFFGLFTGQM